MRIKTLAEFIFSVLIIFTLMGYTSAVENMSVDATINTTATILSNFLDAEAGISAYTNATTTINLNYAKNACRTTPEIETTKYFICSVPVTGLPDTEDAHVYVSKSGWILAYHMKEFPVSKIVQWVGYDGGTIATTTLADVIRKVATSAGVSFSPIKYYDFRYPGANRMMMIVDWAPDGGYDSYQFKVPGSFVLNENSHSWRYGDAGCWNSWAWRHIDGSDSPTYSSYYVSGTHVAYGYYASMLSPDEFHTIDINSYCYGKTGINTVLVYRQP